MNFINQRSNHSDENNKYDTSVRSQFHTINHQIMSYMSELCTILPHSKSHHTNYIEMRTSLMIIILCTSDSIRISCGGFFQMSSRVFLRVINVLYTVTTFLWQMK
ncbi:uncharacterized protein LOC128735674 [Sabethes cyaneus]|uniref:uncharacterized protein LOC128735674 n=1 Tax=Sabethes cyaneus TaxID=53552 RepID=UPI00237E1700|nr:uncharacterized protein LOC128735674 [Sabethes cyaneus]